MSVSVNSLGFEMLDRHVVDGRGDHIACADGDITFAKLTERAAELGGGLRMVGVEADSAVFIDLPPGREFVTVVCAVIRLGAIPTAEADVRIRNVDGVSRVQTHEHDLELAFVQRAGRAEPAPSLKQDVAGYEEGVLVAFGDTVRTLLAGQTVV